uniref:Uncharacterized protein n=1 Tax=Anopheles epiroticus TaxID=199890 RepID=A0A182PAV2_9DIPT
MKELEGCGVNLFSSLMTRLQQQVEEYTACQQGANQADTNRNCSDSVRRATVDLQQQLDSYKECTKNIRLKPDSRTELIECSSVLFHLAAIRISQQFEEFLNCKQQSKGDCSDSIQRATDDLQQGLHNFIHCTKDIS